MLILCMFGTVNPCILPYRHALMATVPRMLELDHSDAQEHRWR